MSTSIEDFKLLPIDYHIMALLVHITPMSRLKYCVIVSSQKIKLLQSKKGSYIRDDIDIVAARQNSYNFRFCMPSWFKNIGLCTKCSTLLGDTNNLASFSLDSFKSVVLVEGAHSEHS